MTLKEADDDHYQRQGVLLALSGRLVPNGSATYNTRMQALILYRSNALLVAVALLGLLTGCSTIPVEEGEPLCQAINEYGDETIAQLLKNDPGLQQSYDVSVGYFVGRFTVAKAPVGFIGSRKTFIASITGWF